MSAKIKPQEVPLTPDQENARQKMLASPCPYCSNPKLYQVPLSGEAGEEITSGIARIGKFWKRTDGDEGMLLVKNRSYGEHWGIHISGKHFIDRFKDFSIDILSFKSKYRPWMIPAPSHLFWLEAGPTEIARMMHFSICRITHMKSPVVIDAHRWFSHGAQITVHSFPKELTSAGAGVLKEAMEFFRPEERGAPKFKLVDIVRAIQKIGEEATQAEVAKGLGVAPRTLQRWADRNGLSTWGEVKERYKNSEIW